MEQKVAAILSFRGAGGQTLRKILICLLAVFLAAGPAQAGAGLSSTVTVTSINVRDSATDIRVTGFNNPFPCTNNEWIRIENSVGNGDMMRATLLTAYAMGKPVAVWVGGCATDGVSTVLAVWITP